MEPVLEADRAVLYPLPRRQTARPRREIRVHPTAIVESGAELGEGCEIGPGAIVGSDVRLGERVHVGAHSILMGRMVVDDDVRIWPSAILGAEPQDKKYRGADTAVHIGARTEVREFATVHRGTDEGSVTVVGADVLLMATSHVAHDCIVDDGAILANGVLLAGHIHVGPRAILSGNSMVHQFTRIGELAYVGGGSLVRRDVPPYGLLFGDSLLRGINREGLRRAGFEPEVRAELSELYRILRRHNPALANALSELREAAHTAEGRRLVEFVAAPSSRGYCRF